MKQNRIEDGRFTEGGRGLGTVTGQMIRRRAREIAVINGRSQNSVLESDIEEARRELRGEERLTPIPTAAETLPEEDRWEPTPVDEGRKVEAVPAFDEQTFAEELFEEGVADAEHDQSLQATKESLLREKRS